LIVFVLFPATSPVSDPQTGDISYVLIYLVFTGGDSFNRTFTEEIVIFVFVILVSIKLVTFVAIYPKRFVPIVVDLALQQTSAALWGALDV